MHRSLFFATTVLVAALACDARSDEAADKLAADKPAAEAEDPAAMFKQLDSNADGKLRADEVPEERRRLFDRLLRHADKDEDGALDAKEFAAGLTGSDDAERPDRPGRPDERRRGREGRQNVGRMFERLDTNGDGKVAIDEVPEERREGFERLIKRGDKDNDNSLDREEFAQAFARGRPDGPPGEGDKARGDGPSGAGAPPDKERPRGPQGRPEGRPEGRPDARGFFERLDANGDGKVTADEQPEPVRARIEKMIERADKDGDKAVSMEEFRAMPRPEGRPGGKGPQGRPGGERPDRRPGPGDRRGPPPLFGALDADRDGKLTSEEISAAADVLRKLDKDGDGVLVIEEFGPPPPPEGPENE